jgi:hypothetical protein
MRFFGCYIDLTYMIGFYPSILKGWGKDKGVPHVRACGAAAGRVVGVARKAGGERVGVARFCHSPLIIAGVSTLLHYGKCGLALNPWVTISWSPQLAPSPPRCRNKIIRVLAPILLLRERQQKHRHHHSTAKWRSPSHDFACTSLRESRCL